MAGLAVWATYAIGRSLIGELGGSIAALFLATSPAFCFSWSNPPMSDIAAAAWWNTALFSGVAPWASGRVRFRSRDRGRNSDPSQPGAARDRSGRRLPGWPAVPQRAIARGATARVVCRAVGPRCVAVAYINVYWYGSPLESGYGALAGELFKWGNVWPNLTTTQGRSLTAGTTRRAEPGRTLQSLARGRSGRERTIARSVSASPLPSTRAMRSICRSTLVVSAIPVPRVPDVLHPPRGGRSRRRRSIATGLASLGVAVLVVAVTVHAMAFGRSREPSTRNRVAIRDRRALHQRADAASSRVPDDVHSGSVRHYSGRLTVRYAPEFLILENVALSQGAERDRGLNVIVKVATYFRIGTDGN